MRSNVRCLCLAFLSVAALALTSCATMRPPDFAKSATRFELDRFFEGHNRSWGVFENTEGQPRRTFVCDSYGKRDAAGDLVLTQHFRFDDGKTQERIWHIHRVDDTHWSATANDMVGRAIGEGQGNALYWEYAIKVTASDPLSVVHIRQWMYQPEGTNSLMTRLIITKLGLTLFEVSEVIHHVPDG